MHFFSISRLKYLYLTFLFLLLAPLSFTYAESCTINNATPYKGISNNITISLTDSYYPQSYFYVNKEAQVAIKDGHWNADLTGATNFSCSGNGSCVNNANAFISYGSNVPNSISFNWTPSENGFQPILTGTQNLNCWVDVTVIDPPPPTPTPTPYHGFAPTIKSSIDTGLGNFKNSAITQLLTIGGYGFIVLWSILMVFKLIHWFIEIMNGKRSSIDERNVQMKGTKINSANNPAMSFEEYNKNPQKYTGYFYSEEEKNNMSMEEYDSIFRPGK